MWIWTRGSFPWGWAVSSKKIDIGNAFEMEAPPVRRRGFRPFVEALDKSRVAP
ncbi:hypothetical protein GCM10017620_16130 [Brevundimonas intermedia]|uniref:Uncharacterized protein n=1 Tax=Brevundimonas intermedia TaxID=74315 RepID=A0ABQ5T791_9CAUL|nr:hypothetical protein GCM10017620_16130 [Brevundimonas intermedia]